MLSTQSELQSLALAFPQADRVWARLVASFSRVADLEDDLDQTKETERTQRSQIDILEYERKEHLHALESVARLADLVRFTLLITSCCSQHRPPG